MRKPIIVRFALWALLLFSLEAWATISYVYRYRTNSSTSTTSMKLYIPAYSQVGDLMIAQLATTGSCANIKTVPSGWTLIRCDAAPSGGTLSQALYYKFMVSGETASSTNYSWAFTSSVVGSRAITSYRDVDTTTPIEASGGQGNAASTTVTAPSVTTLSSNSLLVVLMAASSSQKSSAFSTPSGMTERFERKSSSSPGNTIVVDDETRATAGATGTRTSTFKTSASSVGQSIALRTKTLVAHWRMDEPSWNGTAGEVIDAAGNSLSGAAKGGLLSGAAKLCYGGDFTSGAGYVEVADNSLLDFSSTFSASFWVKPTSWPTSGYRPILSKKDNYEFRLDSNGKLYWYWLNSGSTARSLTSTATLPINTWTHVAVTYASGTQKIYINGVASGTATYAETLKTSSNTLRIGWDASTTGSNGFLGQIDEVKLYDEVIGSSDISADMTATRTCATVLHHVRIVTDGQACNGDAESITLKACADDSCSALYPGNVTVTLSPTSTWSTGSNAITFGLGEAAVTLTRTTNGSLTLAGTVTSPTSTETAARCIGPTGCTYVVGNTNISLDIPSLTACKPETDGITVELGCPNAVLGNQNISFYVTYLDPTSGSSVPKYQVGAGSYTNLSTSSAAPTVVTLNFTDPDGVGAGTATTNLRYDDAGQFRVTASVTVGGQTVTTTADVTSVPAALVTTATATCSAGNATCPQFAAAGSNFSLNARAVCWESDTDTDFTNNATTPNFRMSNIPLVATLVHPSGGTTGTVTPSLFDMAAADNGSKTLTATYSEVGVASFAATPAGGGYFGLTVDAVDTGNVGRFYPHHFDTTVTQACTSGATPFTYSGQPFSATVTARNAANTTTANYDNGYGYAKATTLSAVSAGTLTAGTAVAASAFTAGVSSTLTPTFVFTTTPTTARSVGLRAVDADTPTAVSSASGTEGTIAARSGRMRIANAFGSALLPLSLLLQAEYYNSGGVWAPNTDDACAKTLNVPTAANSGLVFGAQNSSNALASGEIAAEITGATSGSVSMAAANGLSTIKLRNPSDTATGPGLANFGYVDVNLWAAGVGWPAWLPSATANGLGRAAFGLYRGSDRFIYRQEAR